MSDHPSSQRFVSRTKRLYAQIIHTAMTAITINTMYVIFIYRNYITRKKSANGKRYELLWRLFIGKRQNTPKLCFGKTPPPPKKRGFFPFFNFSSTTCPRPPPLRRAFLPHQKNSFSLR